MLRSGRYAKRHGMNGPISALKLPFQADCFDNCHIQVFAAEPREESLRLHELTQLKSLPLFSEMSEASLESLLDAALLQPFPTGVVLIHEGEPADFLHILLDG